ncbi:MAG: DUF4907 domain-containing protein [Bacteroidetes bacterium]|nr:DUF4907 domain-containing protein [Bacteroidota bacterium]
MKKILFPVFLFFSGSCLISCGNDEKKTTPSDSNSAMNLHNSDTPNNSLHPPLMDSGAQITVKTYEVTDSAGRISQGWGYDLFLNGKRVIHQPIIPGLPGNNGFKTQALAESVGELAAKKMREQGSLPSISIHDLDSLGAISHHLADSLNELSKKNSHNNSVPVSKDK